MSSLSHQKLMRFHDGELSPSEAESLSRELAGDPQQQEVLEGLQQVGDFVRVYAEERSSSAIDIANAVMAQIEEETSSRSKPNLEVLPGGVTQSEPAKAAPRASNPPTQTRILWAGMTAAVVAAAAGVALWVTSNESSNNQLTGTVENKFSADPLLSPSEELGSLGDRASALSEESSPAVAIVSVDFGSREGSIFMVSAGGESTPVVWLMDDSKSVSNRMDPL